MKQFIFRNFYVDDGLTSVTSEEESINLLTHARRMMSQISGFIAIAAVAYLRVTDTNGQCHVGFIMGKSKLTPSSAPGPVLGMGTKGQ